MNSIHPVPEAPRCKSLYERPNGAGYQRRCFLNPGHQGLHKDIDGHEWSIDNEYEELASWVKS